MGFLRNTFIILYILNSSLGCGSRIAADEHTIGSFFEFNCIKLTCLNLSETITKNDEIQLIYGYCDSSGYVLFHTNTNFVFNQVGQTDSFVHDSRRMYSEEGFFNGNRIPDFFFAIVIELDNDANVELKNLNDQPHLAADDWQKEISDDDLLGYIKIPLEELTSAPTQHIFTGRKIFDKFHYVLETKFVLTF